MEENEPSTEIDIEFNEIVSNPYHRIKVEYRKIGIKILRYLSIILIIFIIHFTLIYPVFLIPSKGVVITGLHPYRFNLSINWAIFSIGAFLIFYLLKIVIMRVTPLLKQQIYNDINDLGFIIQEKRKSWIIFLILNSISIVSLFLVEFDILSFNPPPINTLFTGILAFYLFLSIIIPIIWRFYYDGLIIPLKSKYHISINPSYKIGKIKNKDSQLIGIFLTSNRIANKFSKRKKTIYTNIIEDRWLPRKRKSIISKYSLTPFLRFYEFSTPLNFQRQFLNISLALKEWDNKN
ncbi:MAG: hypothetical protein ACFFA4_06250 [Promethearchaeota archaeon]